MKLLFLGDIVGRPGRDALNAHLPRLREQFDFDFVVANGENAAHGFGITRKICEEIFEAGVDVITGGNHSWDQAEIIGYIDEEPRLLRPANFRAGTPGRGTAVYDTARGHRVLVVNVMGRLFMEPLDDPFQAIDEAMPDGAPVESGFDFVLVDFHGEATSEKYATGHYCDGRASLVVGTHTHVPTADAHVLAGGTGFQCDAGMCGDYDSVIGMKKELSMERLLGRLPRPRMEPAEGDGTLCGVVVETNPRTGLAVRVEPLRVGGRLSVAWPG
ncbi:TIGR00282 family metallophosphoesterase [Marivibrio halodurans]|uniref:TIGR00282 family metallophosphoesterase n=1 Tax=Marivibrio halodurans TaxID=2039722 RepID=A0A8J7S0L0_9PROT|nr:TIGR00282 family metallophosphoesterase [Marivibrio halodurans]MBP5857695.1 TIGR00282 family metallophosphoesterase [Marivibrio halodurans]